MSNDISRITGTQASETRSTRAARGDAGRAKAEPSSTPVNEVTLSSDASKIINIESRLKNLPDMDQARVERIRAAVANGDYHVDPRRVAQKFLELDGQL